MSTTTMTMASAPIHIVSMSTTPCCPSCGADLALDRLPAFADTQAALLDAHAQIADLQTQVRILNQEATQAIDRWADYEDELAKLRDQLNRNSARNSLPKSPSPTPADTNAATPPATATPVPPPVTPSRSGFLTANAAATRISNLLSPRKSTPNLKPSPPIIPISNHAPSASLSSVFSSPLMSNRGSGPYSPAMPLSPTPSVDELMDALSREQGLRIAAEGKLNDTSREVEELSVKLFEQANEMVASERRARAKLEERVETLEKRDVDKKKRLERLESAMQRIERVRTLLGQGIEQAREDEKRA